MNEFDEFYQVFNGFGHFEMSIAATQGTIRHKEIEMYINTTPLPSPRNMK